jgi:hypothetical protein
LRNKVYEYVIGGNDITPTCPNKTNNRIKLFSRPSNSNEKPTVKAWKNLSSLTCVCYQLREETSVLRFQLNTFINESGDIFGSFLWQLKETYAGNISKVSFRVQDMQRFNTRWECTPSAEYLKYAPGLTTIIATPEVCPGWVAILEKYAEGRELTLVDETKYPTGTVCGCSDCKIVHQGTYWTN